MSFSSKFYLKLINKDDQFLNDCNFKLVNLCCLSFQDNDKSVFTFSVFEPKDLTAQFFQRLQVRFQNADYSTRPTVLYIPHFLKHRFEMLSNNYHFDNLKVVYTSFLNIKKTGQQLFVRHTARVVCVDDSPVILKLLKHTMQEFEFIDVVAQVSSSKDAVATILKHQPDFVTMDIQMPQMTGVEVVRELLSKSDYKVLMISSLSKEEGSLVFEALNSGAFDYIQKPNFDNLNLFKEELLTKILAALEGKAIRTAPLSVVSQPIKNTEEWPNDLFWCLGASTGGTQALTRICTNLPTKIPPVLIVQHIPPVYSKSFAESLNHLCPFTVKEAEQDEPLLANHVYVAPGGLQMGVVKKGLKLHIQLSDSAPVNRFKPSVDYLFSSVSEIKGFKIIAGVLTGMGRDGAEGLLSLKKNGVYTFAQDESSSTVYGMPRAAHEIGAALKSIHLDDVARELVSTSLKLKS